MELFDVSSLKHLPTYFSCSNSQWSISVHKQINEGLGFLLTSNSSFLDRNEFNALGEWNEIAQLLIIFTLSLLIIVVAIAIIILRYFGNQSCLIMIQLINNKGMWSLTKNFRVNLCRYHWSEKCTISNIKPYMISTVTQKGCVLFVGIKIVGSDPFILSHLTCIRMMIPILHRIYQVINKIILLCMFRMIRSNNWMKLSVYHLQTLFF